MNKSEFYIFKVKLYLEKIPLKEKLELIHFILNDISEKNKIPAPCIHHIGCSCEY